MTTGDVDQGFVSRLARHRAQHDRHNAGFSLIELMAVVVIVGILARIAVPVYTVIRQRACDRIALSDVVNAGKALEGLDSTTTFTSTVVGPASIPNLPGPRVSKGSTVYVQRTLVGTTYSWYVRGSHSNGTITYYFQDRQLSASSGTI